VRGRGDKGYIKPTNYRLDCSPLRNAQGAASSADLRTTMRYDRARTSMDRNATYIATAFIAEVAR
jgi:hypothetical protein